MKCCFEICGEIMSPSDFVSVVWTQSRIPYSFPKQMVVHYNKVELSKTLENMVELERQMILEVFARLSVNWLLYSLLTQIFPQLVEYKKEYMKRNQEMNKVDKVNMVDKEVENYARGT